MNNASVPDKFRNISAKFNGDYAARKACSYANGVQLFKLVQTPLASLEPLFKSETFDVKFIHLYRDPRGVLNSMLNKYKTKSNATEICEIIRNNLDTFRKFAVRYPGNIMQISYEELSSKIVRNTQKLMKFAYDLESLVQGTLNFLAENTRNYDDSSMLKRNTTYNTDGWRYTISSQYLLEIEKNSQCRALIKRMKYALFDNIENARNKALSMWAG